MRRFALVLTAVLILGTAAFAKPDMEITAPLPGAVISGRDVSIAVNFSSREKPVTKVEVFLDGIRITERVFEDGRTADICYFRWDTLRVQNGRHRIDTYAFAGEECLAESYRVVTVANAQKDISPPKVAITSPREGQIVSGVTSIIIEAEDDSGADTVVSIYIDGSLRTVKNSAPYTYDWDTTAHDNGALTIEATAVDGVNNTASAKSIKVTVRNSNGTAPGVPQKSSGPVLAKSSTGPLTPRETARANPETASNVISQVKGTVQESSSQPAEIAHTVKAGDCIERLAKSHGVTVQSIVSLNNIANPDLIQIGDELRIPAQEVRMIPIKPVFEKIGGTLIWQGGSDRVVRAVSGNLDVTLTIGSSRAVVNGIEVEMDRPAEVISDQTLVPETFVTRTLLM